MTFPKVRVVVFAVLFLAWLGFLLFLVVETKKTHVARPQFLVAQAVLLASVRDDDGKADPDVTVKEVLWGGKKLHAGQQLRLTDLLGLQKVQGYAGSGDYVIPLMQHGAGWQIAPIATPGYARPKASLSHATLEIIDAGGNQELVLERLLAYAKEKPREADDLPDPFLPAIALSYLGRAYFLGPIDWDQMIDLPRGPIRRRLPFADALTLKDELENAGAKVIISPVELRIYPATPEVRAGVDEILSIKKK